MTARTTPGARPRALALILLLALVPAPGTTATTLADVVPPPAPAAFSAEPDLAGGTVALRWATPTVELPADVETLAAALPTARHSVSAALAGDHVLLVGGDDGAPLADVLSLDPATGAVAVERPVHAAGQPAVAWDGARAIVAGGCAALECPARNVTLWRSDVPSVTAPFQAPKGAWRAGAFWHAGALHVIGGDGCGGPCDRVRAFNPTTGATAVVASLPVDLRDAALAWTGEVAYVFGGRSPMGVGELDTILAYDPAARAVTTLDARLPAPRAGAAAVWDGEAAYVFGGHDGASLLDDVLRFDPARGVVERVGTLPTPLAHAAAAFAEGAAFLAGGETPAGPSSAILRVTHTYGPVPVRVDEYRVYRGQGDAEPHELVATLPGDALGHVDAPPFGGPWRYTVSAVTDGEEGPRAPTLDAALRVPAPGRLAAATGPGFGEITLSWQRPHLTAGAVVDTGARLSVPRWETEAVWTGEEVLVIGGAGGAMPIESYDPVSGAVATRVTSVDRATGQAVWDGAAVTLVGGGCGAACTVLRYDPAGDTLTASPLRHPPGDRWMSAAEADGEIVVFGGDCRCRNVTWLDFADNASTSQELLPAPLELAPAVRAGDAIYLFGGYRSGALTSILRYDVPTRSIATLDARLPFPVSNAQAFFDGRYVHLLGGATSDRNLILRFDVLTHETMVEDARVPDRGQFGLASDRAGAWIVGGYAAGGAASDVIWRYTPGRVVDAVEAYRVYAGADAASLSLVAELPGTQTSYTEGGLGPDATRVYRVSAVVSGVESFLPAPVVGETFKTPEPPAGLVASATWNRGEIFLTWNATSDDHGFKVSGYKVFSGASPDALTYLASVGTFSRSYAHRGLGDGAVRYYAVLATSAAGDGRLGETVRGVSVYAPTAVQNLVAIAPEPRRILVDWDAPADDGGTEVYRYDVTVSEPGERDRTFSITDGDTRFLDVTDSADVRTYTVVPMNGASLRGPAASVVGRALAPPGPPQNLTSETDFLAGTVTLRWDPPLDDGGSAVTSYVVERTRPGSITVVSTVDGDTHEFTDDSIGSTTYYEYRVRARNAIGAGAPAGPVCGGVCP